MTGSHRPHGSRGPCGTQVVDAMWILRTVSEEEGQDRYGPEFRSWDYHMLRHISAANPRPDVTGGGPQTYMCTPV